MPVNKKACCLLYILEIVTLISYTEILRNVWESTLCKSVARTICILPCPYTASNLLNLHEDVCNVEVDIPKYCIFLIHTEDFKYA